MAAADLTTTPYKPAVIVSDATTEVPITLDPNRQYFLQHLGLDADGTTAGAELIVLRIGTATVDGDLSQATDKAALVNGIPIYLGPGISAIYAKSVAGAPCFQIIPIHNDFGDH